MGLAFAIAGLVLVTVLHSFVLAEAQQGAELHATNLAESARQGPLSVPIRADDDEIVQVIDSGRLVAASSNAAGSQRLSAGHPVGGESAWTVTDPLGITGDFRLVGVRLSGSSTVVYVATSLQLADDTATLVRNRLLIGTPLLLALIASLTWIAVGRSLRPVEEIRSEVAEISSSDLSRRVPVPGADDEISRLATTMNAMLDRLQASSRKQRRFVADASHELKSPLAAARTDLEVALAHPERSSWPKTAVDLLAQIHTMQRLVGDLLFIAHADNGRTLPEPSLIDLHEVVLEEVSHVPPMSHCRLDSSGVEPAFVSGRRDDLARVVRNLLDNAVRHAGSIVTISLRSDDDVVSLVIDDDGAGIPPEDWDRVFERFTRLDEARSRSIGGTGLGLAIVKEIIEQHHGQVTAQGGAVGARFVVTLPAG